MSPNNHEIICAIGDCYRALGNLDLAESYMHKALTLDTHNADIIYNMACIRLYKGDVNSARDLFINALNLDCMYAEPLCGLGCIELSKGNTDLAIEYFVQAQRMDHATITPKLEKITKFINLGRTKLNWQEYQLILTPVPPAPAPYL